MKKILYAVMALVFLTGCALTTIRPAKHSPKKAPKPVRRAAERRVSKPKPAPRRVVVDEKEEILQAGEDTK